MILSSEKLPENNGEAMKNSFITNPNSSMHTYSHVYPQAPGQIQGSHNGPQSYHPSLMPIHSQNPTKIHGGHHFSNPYFPTHIPMHSQTAGQGQGVTHQASRQYHPAHIPTYSQDPTQVQDAQPVTSHPDPVHMPMHHQAPGQTQGRHQGSVQYNVTQTYNQHYNQGVASTQFPISPYDSSNVYPTQAITQYHHQSFHRQFDHDNSAYNSSSSEQYPNSHHFQHNDSLNAKREDYIRHGGSVYTPQSCDQSSHSQTQLYINDGTPTQLHANGMSRSRSRSRPSSDKKSKGSKRK
jgi:hypothetical protein